MSKMQRQGSPSELRGQPQGRLQPPWPLAFSEAWNSLKLEVGPRPGYHSGCAWMPSRMPQCTSLWHFSPSVAVWQPWGQTAPGSSHSSSCLFSSSFFSFPSFSFLSFFSSFSFSSLCLSSFSFFSFFSFSSFSFSVFSSFSSFAFLPSFSLSPFASSASFRCLSSRRFSRSASPFSCSRRLRSISPRRRSCSSLRFCSSASARACLSATL
mmetsp:Transcript_16988/g.53556  ORF Transcript_16988/g.53556 Transcript_16988/m.53556 type:complete len:210 (+) Transcript_16988:605-1234(+)